MSFLSFDLDLTVDLDLWSSRSLVQRILKLHRVHFVYDAISIQPTTTQMKFCQYVIDCSMPRLFINKMLQKRL